MLHTCPAKSHAMKVTFCDVRLPPSSMNSPISIPTVDFPKTIAVQVKRWFIQMIHLLSLAKEQ